MDNIKIGNNEYFVAKPVFIILDTLKNETGIDFAMGMDESVTRTMLSDMKKLPKVISLITTNDMTEEFDEELAAEREQYFYRNAQMSDFIKALGFFSQQLKTKESAITEPSKEAQAKPRKGNLKLVKAN